MGRMSDICIEIDELVGEAYENGFTTPNGIVSYVIRTSLIVRFQQAGL